MDQKFMKSIFNQYFFDGPEILTRSVQAGPVHDVEMGVHHNLSEINGEHFTSHTKRVHLHFVSPHREQMNASMIIKTQKNWENSIQTSNYNTLFRTEIKMYTTLLPMMRGVMTQDGNEREDLWPVMYGYQSADIIALQDLTAMGFEIRSMRTGLGANDSLLVVQNIARFHATSKPLVDCGSVSLPSGKSSEIVFNKIFKTLFEVLCHSMETDWRTEWLPLVEWVRDHHDDVLRIVGQLQLEYDKRFAVVNHGDLWTSNIMFRKTGSENSLTSVRFVDFQLSNVNSFIWDLEFFFWTSMNPKIRTTMKSSLLKEYHKSLEANLKILGYFGYIPTLDDVIAESKRIEIASLVFLLFSAVVRSDVPRALDMDKLMSHSPLEIVNKEIFTNRKAQKIIGDDLKYLSELGVFGSLNCFTAL